MNLILLLASVGYCGFPLSSQASNIIATTSSHQNPRHKGVPSIVAIKSCFLVHTTGSSVVVNDTPQYLSNPNSNFSLKQQYGECQQQYDDDDNNFDNDMTNNVGGDDTMPPPPPSDSFQSLTERILSWLENSILFLWMLFPKLARAARSNFNKMKRWYSHRIDVQPLITKSLSSGLLSFVGDSLAQLFEMVTASDDDDDDEEGEDDNNNIIDTNDAQEQQQQQHKHDDSPTTDKITTTPSKKPSSSSSSSSFTYDIHRTISQILEAIFISGPVLHYAYDLFEILLPTETPSSTFNHLAALLHLLLDNLVMDAFFVASMLCAPGLYEGRSFLGSVIPEMKRDFSVAWKASLCSSLAFSPVQFLCFRFLSVRYRVLAINCQDVVWTMVISVMAYRSRRKRQRESEEGEKERREGGDEE